MALYVESGKEGEDYAVSASGEVDLYSSPKLREAIQKGADTQSKKLVVDLRDVSYMDSSGVATLVEGLRATSESEMGFALRNPSDSVMKVLQLSRLDSVFDISQPAQQGNEETR
jgi:anti-sigma B factor antagonist